MKIAIGCDEAAYMMKEEIKSLLESKGHKVEDFGTLDGESILYPVMGFAVAESIVKGENDRGILMCGTGIGMAICANKVPGIHAAVCHDPYSTERSRKSNDVQIMTMGARVIGIELAKYLVNIWLDCDFDGGGSIAKMEIIENYDHEHRNLRGK